MASSELEPNKFDAWQSTVYKSGQYISSSLQSVLLENTANWSGLLSFKQLSPFVKFLHSCPNSFLNASFNSRARNSWRRHALDAVFQFFKPMFLTTLWLPASSYRLGQSWTLPWAVTSARDTRRERLANTARSNMAALLSGYCTFSRKWPKIRHLNRKSFYVHATAKNKVSVL